MDQLLYTISQCCRLAAIGRTTFYGLVASGEIPIRKVGKKTLVAAADLKRWADRLPAVGAKPANRMDAKAGRGEDRMTLDLRAVARALGGSVSGCNVVAPGPGHSRADRSLSIKTDPSAPDGFIVHSFAGDSPTECRGYVRAALGLGAPEQRRRPPFPQWSRSYPAVSDDDTARRSVLALRLWNEARDPCGTIVGAYFASRGLVLPGDIAGDVIRFHPALKFSGGFVGGMVALLRDIRTNEPCGIHRTFLSDTGHKLDRKMLGRSRSAAITRCAGDYHRTAPIETFTDSKNERHPTDLAGLRGARLVTAVETEEGRRWAESKIKALTGGDKIAARFMRQDFFEFTPQFKLLIAGNHKPGLRSVDEAIRRRLHLIPFSITIPLVERDAELPGKLERELPGVLAWIIQGCLDWQEHGLLPPNTVTTATAAYLEAEDSLGAWIDECCVRDANGWERAASLFASWTLWAGKAGELVGSQKRFSERLGARGIEPLRKRDGRGFIGLSLRST